MSLEIIKDSPADKEAFFKRIGQAILREAGRLTFVNPRKKEKIIRGLCQVRDMQLEARQEAQKRGIDPSKVLVIDPKAEELFTTIHEECFVKDENPESDHG